MDSDRKAYPGSRLLIVSNSAGTGSDKDHAEADVIEKDIGVKVLRHSTKKPGCHEEIMKHFRDSPDSGVLATWAKGPLDEILFLRSIVEGKYGEQDSKLLLGLVPWAPIDQPTAVFDEIWKAG